MTVTGSYRVLMEICTTLTNADVPIATPELSDGPETRSPRLAA